MGKSFDEANYPKGPCGDWLAHWKKITGNQHPICSRLGCQKDADIGALIKTEDNIVRVFPFCTLHNNERIRTNDVCTKDRCYPPADDHEKCGR